ncbi:hypothetical protein GOODEAATRI_010590, partial [Goodea atripinnis]
VPRMVEGLMSHHCSQVAAAKDHTVVLTEEGYVYTFGLNTFHQLGLTPPPGSAHVPKQVFSKMLKGRAVIGVAAGRFHTALWTREAVYTVGLNGGQLGYLLDPNGEKCVTTPRQVSALHHKDVGIAMAAASDGATVVVTEKGDVYLLTDYQCKKMASRQVFMSDIALSKNGMMFVTPDGEGFSGAWAGEFKKYGEKKEVSVEVCGPSDAGTMYERIRLEKLPFVHRAVSITMDSKGRNFGVLQADPKTSLLEEADEMDSIHDVTLQAGERNFPAHKYILSMRSEFFRKQFMSERCGVNEELDKEVRRSEDAVGCDLLILEKIPADMLEYALHFIYTDACELLVHGARPRGSGMSTSQNQDLEHERLISSLQDLGLRGCSALEVVSHNVFIVTCSHFISTESPNVEFVCNVLVVADQLLITRLKEMCEVDERTFSQKLKTPPSTPTSLRTNLPSLLPTPPSSNSKNILKSSPCPAHAPAVLDLRAIMDMEASSLQTLGATPKSAGMVTSHIKHSPVSSKLSQKQRKMLAMANREASVDSPPSKSAPIVTPSKSSEKTWATAVQSPPSSCSFRALIEEEESRLMREGQPGAQRVQSALGPSVSATPAARRVTFKSSESGEPEKPIG